MSQEQYILEEDPAHAWLHVRRTEIQRLGIAKEITSYSYQRGETVFLEEDRDLATFMRAKEAVGEAVAYKRRYVENSPIRAYDGYLP